MEHYKILVSESYQRDLQNIIYYISHNFDAPYSVLELLNEIEKTISRLSTVPYCYSLVEDSYLRLKEFRKCFVKNYIIFYKIHEQSKTIMIHRIPHGRQNWIDIL